MTEFSSYVDVKTGERIFAHDDNMAHEIAARRAKEQVEQTEQVSRRPILTVRLPAQPSLQRIK